ncbi:glycoside hydrolase family 16 protein [Chitinophaga niabensis]|uniref:Beta-glucanase, GH16 family n=1 Tax=Chitinophaga niabensis TaxID=536979 RepID=A0A1N6DHX1_9BACT|nr:glycoside hydrolase family 16 protein [Chitinophaga niabensis]SIN70419.1 Beta-glucanase, GH16 family [Chitinophaga niabensis]
MIFTRNCLITLIICASHCSYAQKKTVNTSWKLAWSDEFNYKGLPDAKKWGYDVGKSGWGNNELQNYTANDTATAKVANGMLQIKANRHIQGTDTSYTSARLLTKGKYEWTYGRIEVRAKIAKGLGVLPAVWMLASTKKYGGWPNCGEIDIVEHIEWHTDSIYQTVHTGAYNHIKGTQRGVRTYLPRPWDAFHVYAMEWTPEGIDYFIDGIHRYHFPNEHKTPAEWPFDAPFHIIMNISVGGRWEGAKGIDPTIFPATMLIDYVRVYQDKK